MTAGERLRPQSFQVHRIREGASRMLPLLVRHLIGPLHERILRRNTFRYLRELEESQWASPHELRVLQKTRLQSLLRHACTHIPFYRRIGEQVRLALNDQGPHAALTQFPLMDKNTIAQSLNALLWRDAPGGIFEYNTGGSTGEPFTFYFDRRRQGYDQAARVRTHRWFDVDLGDREVFLWGSPIEVGKTDRLKRMRDRLFNQRLLNAFDLSPTRMDQYLDLIERFKPVCLFGYPSSLALLAAHARERHRSLLSGNLRAVFVTGEVCYQHDRDLITACFGVPVADGYGSREAGFIAHECPEGNMHLTAENVIVEIVKDGKPVDTDETGEIVVTHLDAYAMPFIRYRTGDVGRLKPGRCACGRGLPMMNVVQGRTTDFLYLPDGGIKHALSIIYPLRALEGVRQFRVTQRKDYSITVEVVRNDRKDKITREAVERGLRPVVGGLVDISVNMVDRITTTGSGKYRYVISQAKPASQSPVSHRAQT